MRIKWQEYLLDVRPHLWIDVAKLDASWEMDSLYIGPGGSNDDQPWKYEGIREWLISMGGWLWMPIVGLNEQRVVQFTDGRHRFAWLRDHGAKALPITLNTSRLEELKTRFGTQKRVTTVELSGMDRRQAKSSN